MENIIEIKNLHKSFGTVKAVSDLSFRVKKGELFAFLGVNGAGKSTTISMICGTLQKDSGELCVCGYGENDFDKVKNKIGVVFQSSVLDKALSVYDNLAARASLYNITGASFKQRMNELQELLDFKDILNRPVGKLSGGQRRKADVARALIHNPELLILDEPTTGLDPKTRQTLWAAVSQLQKTRGMTVFLTTHYMEEAADADYVVIIDEGKIVTEGTPLDLKNKYANDYILLYSADENDVISLGLPYEKNSTGFRITLSDTSVATQTIIAHPTLFSDYEIIKGKMDDVFLNVTGKKTEERI